MAERKEVLRYEADVSDAERNVKKLGDTEQAVQQKSAKAAEGTGDAVKDLTSQKEKLGAAMRIVGSQASGMVGDLGALVELLNAGSKAALGFGAALAGVAIAGKIYNEIAEAAERARKEMERVTEAHKALRDEALSARERAAGQLEKAGVFGAAGDVSARIEELKRGGISEGVATFGAVAGQLGQLSEEDMRAAMAGFLATGQTAAFGGDQAANAALIQKLVSAGQAPEARAALQGHIADLGDAARRSAVPTGAMAGITADTVLEEMSRRSARPFTDEDKRRIRSVLAAPSTASREGIMRTVFGDQWNAFESLGSALGGSVEGMIGEDVPAGASRSVTELMGIASQVRDDAARGGRSGTPITINQITNGTVINAPRPSPYGRNGAPGGGLSNRSPE